MIRTVPYRMTGGKQRDALTGVDQMLLCTFIFIYPRATADACSAYIVNNGGAIYTRKQITTKIKELDRRRAFTEEAYDAYAPSNLLLEELFWTQGPPIGVAGVNRRLLIDVGECSVTLDVAEGNPTVRVLKPGNYYPRSVNVLLAVEAGDPRLPPLIDGSTTNPRRWISVTETNCSSELAYANFIDSICRDLEVNPALGDLDDYRIFMWENLTAHHDSPMVAQLVEGRPTANRFDIVPRPPH